MSERLVTQALDAAIALLTMATRASLAAAKINQTIATARAEGRDITLDELSVAKAEREAIATEWEALR